MISQQTIGSSTKVMTEIQRHLTMRCPIERCELLIDGTRPVCHSHWKCLSLRDKTEFAMAVRTKNFSEAARLTKYHIRTINEREARDRSERDARI